VPSGRVEVAPRCVVLVEGRSDAAALEVLRVRLGLVDARVEVRPMGGVTNLGHHLAAWTGAVTGLCDGREAHVVVRALRRAGHDVSTAQELAALGFFACREDLEEELIRAVGTDAAVDVVAGQGELGLLRTFQQQPAQRGRPLAAQLHRFAGTTSGRKARLAAALAAAVPLDRVPGPMRDVLAVAHRC
jgi:hypothetical protein